MESPSHQSALTRFTPTGVGTILLSRHNNYAQSVHPHGRGDNRYRVGRGESRAGSPPRAWGQSPQPPSQAAAHRFTPTGVGTMPMCRRRQRLRNMRFTPTGVGTIVFDAAADVDRTVHPHGRGDNVLVERYKFALRGSPPRAWGQSRRRRRGLSVWRFTPTGVGTIGAFEMSTTRVAVHPHGRGDNSRCRATSSGAYGSPPRAWGQSPGRAVRRAATRFTPTGVGTIVAGVVLPAIFAVHPHGRGDNVRLDAEIFRERGSPPRAWGQFDGGCAVDLGKRFTPTGVGTINDLSCE